MPGTTDLKTFLFSLY